MAENVAVNVNQGVDVANHTQLAVGGFVPLTTVDFPGYLSAVVFCQGCMFDCPYCHNPSLLPRRITTSYSWSKIKYFLNNRRGLLEAVVFSGGEPTLQKGLLNAMLSVKELGFMVGLHTAGPYPDRLKMLLPYVDWVGMDIKAPFDQYELITKVPNSGKRAAESVRVLVDSKVPCEFRTTVYPELLTSDKILAITNTLKSMGVTNYKLQKYRSR